MTQSISDFCIAQARKLQDSGLDHAPMVMQIAKDASAKFCSNLDSTHRIAGNAVAEVVSRNISGFVDIDDSNAHLVRVRLNGHKYGITLLELSNYLKTRNDFELNS